MTERRSLIDGLKQTPAVDPKAEKDFVYPPKEKGTAAGSPSTPPAAPQPTRSPISTRIRSDLAAALKRVSLERQLAGTEPHTLQDILEEAITSWLRESGYQL